MVVHKKITTKKGFGLSEIRHWLTARSTGDESLKGFDVFEVDGFGAMREQVCTIYSKYMGEEYLGIQACILRNAPRRVRGFERVASPGKKFENGSHGKCVVRRT